MKVNRKQILLLSFLSAFAFQRSHPQLLAHKFKCYRSEHRCDAKKIFWWENSGRRESRIQKNYFLSRYVVVFGRVRCSCLSVCAMSALWVFVWLRAIYTYFHTMSLNVVTVVGIRHDWLWVSDSVHRRYNTICNFAQNEEKSTARFVIILLYSRAVSGALQAKYQQLVCSPRVEKWKIFWHSDAAC